MARLAPSRPWPVHSAGRRELSSARLAMVLLTAALLFPAVDTGHSAMAAQPSADDLQSIAREWMRHDSTTMPRSDADADADADVAPSPPPLAIRFRPLATRAPVADERRPVTLAGDPAVSIDSRERRRFTCVAWRPRTGWLVTAAHCVQQGTPAIAVQCIDAHGQLSERTLDLDRVRHHPTHDLALLALPADNRCPLQSLPVGASAKAQRPVSLTGIRLPDAHRRAGRNHDVRRHVSLRVIERERHVYRLHDPQVCLTSGDSGYPLFRTLD